jgi:hypothetical protein
MVNYEDITSKKLQEELVAVGGCGQSFNGEASSSYLVTGCTQPR